MKLKIIKTLLINIVLVISLVSVKKQTEPIKVITNNYLAIGDDILIDYRWANHSFSFFKIVTKEVTSTKSYSIYYLLAIDSNLKQTVAMGHNLS